MDRESGKVTDLLLDRVKAHASNLKPMGGIMNRHFPCSFVPMSRSSREYLTMLGLMVSSIVPGTVFAAQENTTFSCAWQLSVKLREVGSQRIADSKPYVVFLKIERHGDKWTGSLISKDGDSMPIDEFAVQDRTVRFQSSVTGPCGKWISVYTGLLEEQALKGTLVSRPAYSDGIRVGYEWQDTRVQQVPARKPADRPLETPKCRFLK